MQRPIQIRKTRLTDSPVRHGDRTTWPTGWVVRCNLEHGAGVRYHDRVICAADRWDMSLALALLHLRREHGVA